MAELVELAAHLADALESSEWREHGDSGGGSDGERGVRMPFSDGGPSTAQMAGIQAPDTPERRATMAAGEWAAVPRGRSGAKSTTSSSGHRSSGSASSVYGSSAGRSRSRSRSRPQVGFDVCSEERSDRISKEFWKWHDIGTQAVDGAQHGTPENAEAAHGSEKPTKGSWTVPVGSVGTESDVQPLKMGPAEQEATEQAELVRCKAALAQINTSLSPNQPSTPGGDATGDAESTAGPTDWAAVLAASAKVLETSGADKEREETPAEEEQFVSEYGTLEVSPPSKIHTHGEELYGAGQRKQAAAAEQQPTGLGAAGARLSTPERIRQTEVGLSWESGGNTTQCSQ